MKTFAEYLNSSKKVYEYRVKVANCACDSAVLKDMEAALAAYDPEPIKSPKSLPCDEYAEFPSFGACEVNLVDIVLNYPATVEQIQTLIANKIRVPAKHFYVVTKAFDEQDRAAEALGKDVKGARLEQELENTPSGQEYVGQQRIENLLKELNADSNYKPEFAKE